MSKIADELLEYLKAFGAAICAVAVGTAFVWGVIWLVQQMM